jgi:hypothetical protein
VQVEEELHEEEVQLEEEHLAEEPLEGDVKSPSIFYF